VSIDNSLDRIIGLVDDSHEAVKEKGGTTATPYLLANLPNAIKSIPEGEDLSAEIAEYGSLNDELEEVINSLPSAGGGGASIETCTVTVGSPMDLELQYLFWSDGDNVSSDWSAVLDTYTGGSITVAKNSIIYIGLASVPFESISINGDATIIYESGAVYVVSITGDCSIESSAGGGPS